MASSAPSPATSTTGKGKAKDLEDFLGLPHSSRRFQLGQDLKFPRRPQPQLQPSNKATDNDDEKEDDEELPEPEVLDDSAFINPKAKLIVTLLEPNSFVPNDPYYLIQDYVNFSQPKNFGVKILKVYQVSRSSEESQQVDEDMVLASTSPQNRMMLWHGTKPERVRSILEKGLLKPSGHLTEGGGSTRGIYFADRIAKSSGYCDMGRQIDGGPIGYLFLCEVQLGQIVQTWNPAGVISSADFPHSFKYLGGLVPEGKGDREVDGVVWPLGATVDRDVVEEGGRGGGGRGALGNGRNVWKRYNEYIVFNERKIKIKYLLKVEFTKQPMFNFYND